MAAAQEQQEEEIEALRLIYSEEFVRIREDPDYSDSSGAGDASSSSCRVVEVKLGKSKGEADGGERLVTLVTYLNRDYPLGEEMPLFELRGVNWSRADQNAVYEGACVWCS